MKAIKEVACVLLLLPMVLVLVALAYVAQCLGLFREVD